jgi:hypothetical protein
MAKDVEIKFENTMTDRLIKYKKRLNLNGKPGVDYNAKVKMGLQLLNWSVNGSSNSSKVPPIMTGQLRGSGTVFVGKDNIGDMRHKYREGTPAKTYDNKPNTITIGFNTIYAARLHEEVWVPGGKIPSKAAKNNPGITADVGNKWVEDHLKADSKSLTKMYALITKRTLNK